MESTDLQRVNFEEGYVAVIDKPYRWSSTDVVRKVKFELRKACLLYTSPSPRDCS